jgi:hypothetical protein
MGDSHFRAFEIYKKKAKTIPVVVCRGSYTAAQKAFEKVLVLSPGSSYARLMIAGIRHRVGRWREAVQDYRLILGKLLERGVQDYRHILGKLLEKGRSRLPPYSR